jgi:hypothetical protein
LSREEEFSNRIWRTVNHCRDLGFNNENIIVVGSAALYLAGVLQFGRDGFPHDIDILTTSRSNFHEACNNYGWDMGFTNGCTGKLIHVRHPADELDLEITQHWPTRIITDEEIASHSEWTQGLRIMGPSFDLASMRQFDRPKDRERIPLVKERLCGTAADAFVPWQIELVS